MSLIAAVAGPITSLSVVEQRLQFKKNVWSSPVGRLQFKKNVSFSPVGLKPLRMQYYPVQRRSISSASRVNHASVICAAALNATCAAEQTQTVTRQSSTITVAPIQGKEKSPELDDGGSGFPPRDDGDGGGGGGGGGGHWSGGFFSLASLLY
ncbi:UNVERIFIED_CONTAM: hypothetical protein Slati_4016700 [Sesamum latifolium]|uniref:Uncharacterized protein n=1 Tax=Sesamum latifolium TaxID=2727402 RepID=A0AAW2TRZ5_9LAMI